MRQQIQTARITIRLRPEESRKIERLARKARVTRTDFVREALEHYIRLAEKRAAK